MSRRGPVCLFDIFTPEEREKIHEDAERWRAEHPTLEDLQRQACGAQLEMRDHLLAGTSPATDLKPPPPADRATLVKKRDAMLTQWEAKDEKRKRSHLYSGKIPNPDPEKSGSPMISKNQFRWWRSGDLSEGSVAAKRLEKYLRQNT